ncbi:MAG: chromosome segregation protein SMC [Thiomonas arsenitoxydans]|uniref:Chromosome partition protein Smc n=1 Tax=Thiomonas arsenitoxydans (strain DSM 22701 / CIP 110005 / 3As) TaxID=426114 RepID=A0A8I1SVL3_THIA3|nr:MULTISPECIES: chromosome segregation protein SMC [Thiomonas]MBN8744307.1 chromosome segregation protein SMC [Thiomonas arsenitoxydans]ODU97243.1 MAG: chromosome segregation protein SMC [Thiomonas sp. SCN 64-16]
MRLTSLRLAGFKSFAEPVTLPFPGRISGIVGPNGCGKSNVIDAVRWVLGESKASELRGESMQDVIFNGSGQRKQASRCSVEMVFDNSDHRIAGQWGQFTEIAIKRVLTRDGTSSYFINNQAVRRRDVQDIFLGTGLGPRSYAIISQGTITRILESRPEDLRMMLEEAAGVSKYKERRRETENRLQDTRENLTRVQDILRELGSNLGRLEQQAEVATRYQGLQASATLVQQQLWLLRQEEAQAKRQQITLAGGEAMNALEARIAEQRAIEAEIETLRQAQFASSDTLNRAQAAFYAAQSRVSQLEAEIRFVVEGRQRAQAALQSIDAQTQDWQQRHDTAVAQAADTAERLADAEVQAEVAQARVQEQSERLPTLEAALSDAQLRAADERAQAAAAQQALQAEASRQRGLGQQIQQLQQRAERLRAEQRAVVAPDSLRLADLQRQQESLSDVLDTTRAQREQLEDTLPELQQARQQAQQSQQAAAAQLAATSARLAALKALQERVLTEGKLRPWLAKHGLDGLSQLWSRLQVENGLETALEAVLRERLSALELRQLDMAEGFAADAPPAKLAFYSAAVQPPAAETRAISVPPAGCRPLRDGVRSGDAGLASLLDDWLATVFIAPSLQQALALRATLPAQTVLLTREGHTVSRQSVSFYAPDSEQSGVLARQQEIDNLERQIKAEQLIGEQSRAQLHQAEHDLGQAQEQLAALQRRQQQDTQQLHTVQVELLKLTQQAEQSAARNQQIATDLGDIDAQLDELQAQQAESEARFEELDARLADQQQLQADLETEVMAAQQALADARAQQRQLESQAAESGYAVRSLQQKRADLQREAQMALEQIARQASAREAAQAELARLSEQGAQTGLQSALAEQQSAQAVLGARRSEADDIAQQLRKQEEARLTLDRDLDPLRQRITELQLKEQEFRLQAEQFAQQLAEAQADIEAVRASLPTDAQAPALAREHERLQRDIAALGAVNLAALDELGQARERKQFLDAQFEDLQTAITTLEDAIRKIDAETRDMLATTFEQINDHFGRMFPLLFGGGNARLIITGEEILDAGVQVMAQPPGKKNSSIHLLSGGEKALVAIALVFAIFQLNPAPFCLLDEVDAPLDDANTERYARLVKDMSASTQFLFISHNKIAMEMADQLIGVTMQEQGVSRTVAVEMDAALRFAQAA